MTARDEDSVTESLIQRLVDVDNAFDEQRTCRAGDEEGSVSSFSSSASRSSSNARNVRWITVYAFLSTAGQSVWNANALTMAVYLGRDGGDAVAVGILAATVGVCRVAASFPSAALARRFLDRVDDVFRSSSLLLASAAAATLWVLWTAIATNAVDATRLTLAFCAWGLYAGATAPLVTALLAESSSSSSSSSDDEDEDGTREVSRSFRNRSAATRAGQVVGPCAALVAFLVVGDEWTVRNCAVVVAVGQIATLPCAAVLWCFRNGRRRRRDKGERRRRRRLWSDSEEKTNEEEYTDDNDDDEEDEEDEKERSNESPSSPCDDVVDDDDYRNDASTLTESVNCENDVTTPSLVLLSNLVYSMAWGTAVRFLPVFLYDDLGLSPAWTQVVYVAIPLLEALLQRAARSSDKLRAALVCQTAGIVSTVAAVWTATSTSASSSSPARAAFVAGALASRAAAAHAAASFAKASLMEVVPRRERATWSLVGVSGAALLFDGSAALGGLSVRRRGAARTFSAAAAAEAVAAAVAAASLASRARRRRANEA